MNLKCTKKLLDKLKIKNRSNTEEQTDEAIENWHSNIFDYGKIYGVLITNDKTLFSFYLFGYRTSDFKYFTEIIREDIFKIMVNSGFEQKQFEPVLESMENITFSKSDNRGILASMNQMLPYIHHSLEQQRDLVDINIGLNDMLNSKLDGKTPREEFESLLGLYSDL
jgi:hypothetical protein